MMRSAILMGSVAAVALATPALALPDHYEQGYSCTGRGLMCIQEQFRLEDGNRSSEKSNSAVGGESAQSAALGSDADDDSLGEEVGDTLDSAADEAGDEISDAADDTGDAIENAADEAGDEISEAADDVGDFFD